jgi:hypothetical protein
MKATERLARHGIAFKKCDGRLVIRHSGRVIDFWPERGLWLERGSNRHRVGVRNLIEHLEKRNREPRTCTCDARPVSSASAPAAA